jgi:hypothetical protein
MTNSRSDSYAAEPVLVPLRDDKMGGMCLSRYNTSQARPAEKSGLVGEKCRKERFAFAALSHIPVTLKRRCSLMLPERSHKEHTIFVRVLKLMNQSKIYARIACQLLSCKSSRLVL